MSEKKESSPAGNTAQAALTAPPPNSGPHPAPPADDVAVDEGVRLASQKILNSIFINGEPKHLAQGIGYGLRNIAAGVGIGATTIAASTYAGAQEGWGGAAKGLGVGILSGGMMALYGVYKGAEQIGRGAYNTPEAVRETASGETFWDSTRGCWVRVNLAEDFAALPSNDEDLVAAGRKHYADLKLDLHIPALTAAPTEAPKTEDVNYYAFLGVEKTATQAEIKRAYMQKALQMHPDKNTGDPDATKKFQELTKMYNILNLEDTRKKYDQFGKVDTMDVQESETNPFAQMLGSQFLEPLVGKLTLLDTLELKVMHTVEESNELFRRRRLRVAQCLASFIDGEAADVRKAQPIIQDAVSTLLGPDILTVVAEQYHAAARQHLYDNGVQKELDSFFTSKWASITAICGVAAAGTTTAVQSWRGKADEEDFRKLLLAANVADLQRVSLHACRLLLFDMSVSAEQRKKRAENLERLARLVMEEVAVEVRSRSHAVALIPPNNA